MSENSALAAWFVPVRYGPARLLVPLTIFLGALLLFAVEPLIAKMILPWFGGSAEVWIACLLFFQAALLAGYLYAHLLTTRISESWQWRAHLLLLSVSLLFLPIVPSQGWKPLLQIWSARCGLTRGPSTSFITIPFSNTCWPAARCCNGTGG